MMALLTFVTVSMMLASVTCDEDLGLRLSGGRYVEAGYLEVWRDVELPAAHHPEEGGLAQTIPAHQAVPRQADVTVTVITHVSHLRPKASVTFAPLISTFSP